LRCPAKARTERQAGRDDGRFDLRRQRQMLKVDRDAKHVDEDVEDVKVALLTKLDRRSGVFSQRRSPFAAARRQNQIAPRRASLSIKA
jgi:hypothetical protein